MAVDYLEKREMEALLRVPDRRTPQGARDYGLLLFLYNTGARASEAAGRDIGDLELSDPAFVRIVGKGGKTRLCPLWETTVKTLRPLIADRAPDEPVFLNRVGERLTRFGIYALVRRNVAKASEQAPSLHAKKVSTHTLRHTAAVHLLRAGVDINAIRAWLGHVSLDTTHIYAEIDLEMKAKALAQCDTSTIPPPKKWKQNPGLMAFLKSL